MDSERVNALLARAQADFLAHTAAQRPVLADLAARAATDAKARAELHRAAHQLHGTAGTLGFTAVSDTARALEHLTAGEPVAADLAKAHADLDAAIAAIG